MLADRSAFSAPVPGLTLGLRRVERFIEQLLGAVGALVGGGARWWTAFVAGQPNGVGIRLGDGRRQSCLETRCLRQQFSKALALFDDGRAPTVALEFTSALGQDSILKLPLQQMRQKEWSIGFRARAARPCPCRSVLPRDARRPAPSRARHAVIRRGAPPGPKSRSCRECRGRSYPDPTPAESVRRSDEVPSRPAPPAHAHIDSVADSVQSTR